jgi:hypothetical protein
MSRKISPNVKFINPNFLNNFHLEPEAVYRDGEITIIDTDLKNHYVEEVINEFHLYGSKSFINSVGVTGLPNSDGVGSNRFCTHNLNIARALECCIINSNGIDTIVQTESKDLYFSGVSDYFRFMWYNDKGCHYPHYDSDFKLNEDCVTKHSLVMYFTDNKTGSLYFCKDSETNSENKYDWDRAARPDEIYTSVTPKVGRIVIFPHTLCHGVSEVKDEYRIMLRGDLIYG